MSANQHTPGPWTLELCRWTSNSDITGFGIRAEGKTPWLCGAGVAERANHCTVIREQDLRYIKTGFSAAECEANARLICAAPELLEACRAARAALIIAAKGTIQADAFDAVEAALAKAEGRP